MLDAALVLSLRWKGILIKNSHRQRTGCVAASGGLRMFDGPGREKKTKHKRHHMFTWGAESLDVFVMKRGHFTRFCPLEEGTLSCFIQEDTLAASPPVLQSGNE